MTFLSILVCSGIWHCFRYTLFFCFCLNLMPFYSQASMFKNIPFLLFTTLHIEQTKKMPYLVTRDWMASNIKLPNMTIIVCTHSFIFFYGSLSREKHSTSILSTRETFLCRNKRLQTFYQQVCVTTRNACIT